MDPSPQNSEDTRRNMTLDCFSKHKKFQDPNQTPNLTPLLTPNLPQNPKFYPKFGPNLGSKLGFQMPPSLQKGPKMGWGKGYRRKMGWGEPNFLISDRDLGWGGGTPCCVWVLKCVVFGGFLGCLGGLGGVWANVVGWGVGGGGFLVFWALQEGSQGALSAGSGHRFGELGTEKTILDMAIHHQT